MGRKKITDEILEEVDNFRNGDSKSILIYGDKGSGKTFFIKESLVKRIKNDDGISIVHLSCSNSFDNFETFLWCFLKNKKKNLNNCKLKWFKIWCEKNFSKISIIWTTFFIGILLPLVGSNFLFKEYMDFWPNLCLVTVMILSAVFYIVVSFNRVDTTDLVKLLHLLSSKKNVFIFDDLDRINNVIQKDNIMRKIHQIKEIYDDEKTTYLLIMVNDSDFSISNNDINYSLPWHSAKVNTADSINKWIKYLGAKIEKNALLMNDRILIDNKYFDHKFYFPLRFKSIKSIFDDIIFCDGNSEVNKLIYKTLLDLNKIDFFKEINLRTIKNCAHKLQSLNNVFPDNYSFDSDQDFNDFFQDLIVFIFLSIINQDYYFVYNLFQKRCKNYWDEIRIAPFNVEKYLIFIKDKPYFKISDFSSFIFKVDNLEKINNIFNLGISFNIEQFKKKEN